MRSITFSSLSAKSVCLRQSSVQGVLTGREAIERIAQLQEIADPLRSPEQEESLERSVRNIFC